MNEIKARYISLTVIALEAILLFFPLSFIFLGMALSELTIQGKKPPFTVIIFLAIYLAIGVLIVLSAFYKIPFYILIVIETLLLALWCISVNFYPIFIIPCLVFLVPIIFYCIVRIVKSS